MRKKSFWAVCCSALLLSSCAQFEVAERAVSYNKAIETAGNQMLLLNAVRSAKRYPMYFSGISIVRGAVPVSGGANFNIPIGGDADIVWSIAPSLDLSTGTSFELPTLDSEAFLKAMATEVSAETLKFFIDNRWPDAVIMNMFVNLFEMPKAVHDEINLAVVTECARVTAARQSDDLPAHDRRRLDSDKALCDIIARNIKQCSESQPDPYGNVTYLGYGRSECGLVRFQGFLRKLRLLDLEIATTDAKKKKSDSEETETRMTVTNKPNTPDQTTTTLQTKRTIESKSDIVGILRKRPALTAIASSRSDVEKGMAANELRFHLRSPLGMLSFLGELIAVQTMPGGDYTPQIVVGLDRDEVPLFEVRRGSGIAENAAITIDHEGDVFYVPRPDFSQGSAARSMQVLSLVSQVTSMQVDPDDLPTATSVNVVGGS